MPQRQNGGRPPFQPRRNAIRLRMMARQQRERKALGPVPARLTSKQPTRRRRRPARLSGSPADVNFTGNGEQERIGRGPASAFVEFLLHPGVDQYGMHDLEIIRIDNPFVQLPVRRLIVGI